MPVKNKRLRIMAGPNGSGKSTVLKEVRKNFESGPFVNADEIEKILRENKLLNLNNEFNLVVPGNAFKQYISNEGKSWVTKVAPGKNKTGITCSKNTLRIKGLPSPYDAALAADFIRHQLLVKGETFTFETVFSHSSKIEFLRQSLKLGYKNYLYFICTVDPLINTERVKQRVLLGGHNVPKEKIEKRYYQSLQLLPSVIPLCHRVFLFDNSSERRSIEPVAEINEKRTLVIHTTQLPWWVKEYILDLLYPPEEAEEEEE